MHVIPINMAEAVFEAFWDPQTSGLKQWRVEPGVERGLKVEQGWCWVTFSWQKPPATGPALRMSRAVELDCRGYDHLLISAVLREGDRLAVVAQTDTAELRWQGPPAPARKEEYAISLNGAQRVRELTLEVHSSADGQGSGWFNWLGLQNAQLLPRHIEQFQRFDEKWDGLLKDESYQPKFQPAGTLLLDAADLEALRRDVAAYEAGGAVSPLTAAGRHAATMRPEAMIRDYVNFWNDDRYCRARDRELRLVDNGPKAALAGLVHRDAGLLRLAARYALSLVMCEHWDDGFICRFPGSAFEHRCFVQSLVCHDCALLLDLAGEMFTNLGSHLIRRRLAEEGMGAITFNTWKHEYIFDCNQLAWFSPGRLSALLALEKAWPRVKPYTDIALRELSESLDKTILPDGGYVEGPTYFWCVGRCGGLSLHYFARARGVSFPEIVPERMRRTAAFAALIASTDEAADVVPICDAGKKMDLEALSVMASLLPESPWAAMAAKSLKRDGMAPTVLGWKLCRDLPSEPPALPALVALPVMGAAASHRRLNGRNVKLLLMGNHAGAGHTHEDKGSFVLEYAGQTFAMDPGTTDYGSPWAEILKHAQSHNMLVPYGVPERPAPACPLPADVKPVVHGDEKVFHAEIDASPGWGKYYRRWRRTWDSPSPEALTIRDDYELTAGEGVEFLWQTPLPVEIAPGLITLRGKDAHAEISFAADLQVRREERRVRSDLVFTRLSIRRPGRSGQVEIRVRLGTA